MAARTVAASESLHAQVERVLQALQVDDPHVLLVHLQQALLRGG
jgi:hypothetical protein